MAPSATPVPIVPSQVDRFTPHNSNQPPKDAVLALNASSAASKYAQGSIESSGAVTHPEGALFFYCGDVVSSQKITEEHTFLASHILGLCKESETTAAVTVYIEILVHNNTANYYIILHDPKTITWIPGQTPDLFKGATRARHEYEYWVHRENFPGPYFSTPIDIKSLRGVLASYGIDALTSEGSTSPMSVEQIMTHLTLLDSFSGEGDIYQTYAIARIWSLILQSRLINKYGTPAARLDRFIGISENPPAFASTYAFVATLMFNRPHVHLGRCSRAWADRIAYTAEWRKFKATNEQEWNQIINLACVLVLASTILVKRMSGLFAIPTYVTILVALASASGAYYLLVESQNLGEHATDASTYFQGREEILYGVQRIAIINAMPQALLICAVILFILSVLCL